MPNTFTLIASSTVGSGGAASIDFSSIASTYTDLVIKYSLRNSIDESWASLKLNNSSANFSQKWLQGNGSSAASGSNSNGTYMVLSNPSTTTASTFTNGEIYFTNYTASSNKSFGSDFVTENNATLGYVEISANLWSNTAAINQITITALTGSFVQYSTAYLYGIVSS
jgi:hypothetical protein